MGIRQWAAEKLFGAVIEEKVRERIKGASVTDRDEDGWRRLTGNTTRDLDPLKQERMIKIAFWLWENNPLARWIVEITKDFILAEGMPYEARNEDVKSLLDDFWFDPLNQMDIYLEKHVRELFLYGELCLPAYTAEQTGKVRLGYMDPAQIDRVETDPDNVKMVIGVILKGEAGREGRKLKTILPEGGEEILSPRAKGMRGAYTDGECFFFAINNVTNSPRGRSDLLATADWLDAYEQFLFDYADKWPLLNSFVWDLQVEGAADEEIRKQVNNFTKKSGSVFGHNEKVKLDASTPDLKSMDAETGARLLRNHILGAYGYPSFWYGGGEDANRAVGVEMGTPAFKRLSSKQRYVKFMIETIFEYVIESARRARYLNVSDEDAGSYSVTTPELAVKDLSKYSSVIQQGVTSLVLAENQKWIDRETSRKIFSVIIGYLGVELDLDEMAANVDEDALKNEFQDYVDKKDKNAA